MMFSGKLESCFCIAKELHQRAGCIYMNLRPRTRKKFGIISSVGKKYFGGNKEEQSKLSKDGSGLLGYHESS